MDGVCTLLNLVLDVEFDDPFTHLDHWHGTGQASKIHHLVGFNVLGNY